MTLILSSTLHVPHGNRYLGILPGESYISICALADFSMCVKKYQQAQGYCWRSLTTKSDHQLRHKRGEINKLKHICIYH